ncbi:MAG TPA: hypothetical protein PKY88_12815 [Anaerohalosphaeraceae bacterium]|nr:hypothetical protein [Anaerohalosphaeraceae bacterium]
MAFFEKVIELYDDCGVDDQQEELHSSGTLTRTFRVVFAKSVTIPKKQVLALSASANGVSIPQLNEEHPEDSRWICRRRSARPEVGALHWRVTCTYEYSENPLEQEPKVEFLFAEHSEIVDVDREGNALLMSSGEPLDPPLEEPFNDLVIRITRNEESFDPLLASQYVDTVNSNTMIINGTSFPAYTIKCESISASKFKWGSKTLWEVSYEFVVRTAAKPGTSEIFGWRRRVLDQGFYKLENGKRVRITDANGEPIVSPKLLNGSGGELPEQSSPYYHYFETKPMKDFSVFNFQW